MTARERAIRLLLKVVAWLGLPYRPEFVQAMLWTAQGQPKDSD